MILNQWSKPALAAAVGLALTVGLAGCGGGGGGGTTDGGGGSLQPQDVNSSGVGELTGFGSVLIGDDSRFSTDDDTVYIVDGVEFANEDAFKAAFGGSDDVRRGAVVVVDVRNGNAEFTAGTAARVEAHTAIKGPVTSLSPLQVLGQTVVVTGDTMLADFAGVADLVVGSEVEVYGFTRAEGNVTQATRIQRKAEGLDEWKLTGFVTTAQPLEIGSQVVLENALERAFEKCLSGRPGVGDFVEVKADPAVQDNNASTLTARRVECKARGLIGEVDDRVTFRRVQGFVSSENIDLDTGTGTFTVGGLGAEGQVVSLGTATTFRNGTLEDLFVGAKVEVSGSFNTDTRVLTASRVSFREARVRIEAPLQPSASDNSLTVLGLNIQGTALLDDDDGVLGSGQVGDNIRMRGFVDRDGNIFATRIDDRGDGTRDLRLRGPVDEGSINAFAQTFSILDITVNPASRYQDSRGANEDAVITAAQFFSIVTDGQPVQVRGGSFSAGSITGPEEIELED